MFIVCAAGKIHFYFSRIERWVCLKYETAKSRACSTDQAFHSITVDLRIICQSAFVAGIDSRTRMIKSIIIIARHISARFHNIKVSVIRKYRGRKLFASSFVYENVHLRFVLVDFHILPAQMKKYFFHRRSHSFPSRSFLRAKSALNALTLTRRRPLEKVSNRQRPPKN